jgi:hypothetical protein
MSTLYYYLTYVPILLVRREEYNAGTLEIDILLVP